LLTRRWVLRGRIMLAGLAIAVAASAAPEIVAAARPSEGFDVSACSTPNQKNLVMTVTWSGFEVSAWSYFVESAEGSGGVFGPLAEPTESGTLTQTFAADDVANILSVTGTLFRSAGPNFHQAASETVSQPASGWPRC
jgi:hypothetical protein